MLSLDFQGISEAGFRTEEAFVKAFSRNVVLKARAAGIPSNVVDELKEYIGRKEEKAILDHKL